jgi:mono/diheme cytochrome c family protein
MARNTSRTSTITRLGACLGLAAAAVFGVGAIPAVEAGEGVREPVVAVPAAWSTQPNEGQRVYNTVCAACHQMDGTGVEGVFPPVAGSEWVIGDEGVLVRIILHGVSGEMMVKGNVYNSMMPPFGGALSNAEVAAVSTYIRRSWGNNAPPVTAATVARIRTANAARNRPWTVGELSPPK